MHLCIADIAYDFVSAIDLKFDVNFAWSPAIPSTIQNQHSQPVKYTSSLTRLIPYNIYSTNKEHHHICAMR